MTDTPASQKEIKLHEAMQRVKESRFKNSKEVGKLNEEGGALEEEERVLKIRIEEHCGLVEDAKEEGRRLEEEEKGLQVELDLLNRPALIDCQSQPDSQVGQSLLVKQLKPIFPTEIFVCIAPHLPAKDQLCLRRLNKKIRNAIPKLLRLNFKYFKDSIDRLLTGLKEHKLFSQIPVHFTLGPKEVEMNPYGVIELTESISAGKYPYHNNFAAIDSLLGPSLRVAVSEILRRSHNHPKFKLLTLWIAAYANYPTAIQFLLKSSTFPFSHYDRAFRGAVRGGFDDIVKILLQSPRVNPAYFDNIGSAAREGRTSTVQLLLQDPRVSPEDDDNYAIRMASKYGHVDVVKLLLKDARVDWKSKNFQALMLAKKYDRLVVLKVLLDLLVANPLEEEEAVDEVEGDVQLEGPATILKKLLQYGKDGLRRGFFTALRHAHLIDCREVVNVLLDHFVQFYREYEE